MSAPCPNRRTTPQTMTPAMPDPLSAHPDDLPEVLRAMRETSAATLCGGPSRRRYWSITRHADVMAAGLDPRLSSEARLGGISLSDTPLPMTIASTGKRHVERRRAQLPHYGREAAGRILERCRERTARTLDALPVGRQFDWNAEVAIPLAGATLCDLMGFPEDFAFEIARWSAVGLVAARLVAGDKRQAKRDLAILAEEARAKRSGVLEAFGPPDDMEFLADLILTLIAGADTTRHSMTGGVKCLAENPHEIERIRTCGTSAAFARETLRWQSSIAYMRRTATEDMEIGGQEILKGDPVALWYLAANRDPAVFAAPERFDPEANAAGRHISFGHGPHRCIGAHLAEAQLVILWDEFSRRYSSVDLEGPQVHLASSFIRGWTEFGTVVNH